MLWLILLTQFLVEMSTRKGMADMALGFSARVEDMATTPKISSLIHCWHFCRRQKTILHWFIKHCSALSFFSHFAHFIVNTVQKEKASSYPPGGAEQQRTPIIDQHTELGEYENAAIMHSMPLTVSLSLPTAGPRSNLQCHCPTLGWLVSAATCWLSHGHTFFSCYCTRKRENEQGKKYCIKYHINLQLKASSSSLSQASRAVSRTAVFQCFQDTFQAVHSWSYSVAHEGTLYPCQGSTAAKSAFISSSISRSP